MPSGRNKRTQNGYLPMTLSSHEQEFWPYGLVATQRHWPASDICMSIMVRRYTPLECSNLNLPVASTSSPLQYHVTTGSGLQVTVRRMGKYGLRFVTDYYKKIFTLCILEIPKWVCWQTVTTQMKCSIMLHFIRVCTVC